MKKLILIAVLIVLVLSAMPIMASNNVNIVPPPLGCPYQNIGNGVDVCLPRIPPPASPYQ